ncbi:hypothetical protein Cgig2_014217 [Carnegiea gigantea]|uniref:Polygalacturonase n=1 Tax=Carnegiea gigantea TaxID=171969 RepID=A0A9Q1GZN5_9CARY|nr:hypothetical protein Cgig2_014217 [Carnegiea gigantea]
MSFKFVVLFVLVYLLSSISHLHRAIFEYNVMDNDPMCDGKTDDRKAFMSTWREACKSTGPSTIMIPVRNCMLGPVEFAGPCKNIDRLAVLGGGTFDCQGRLAWKNNNCAKTGICNLPANIRLTDIINGLLHNITFLDSKMFHINIQNCWNMDLKNIAIDASITSLNIDGIHIGRSNRVNIIGADINTGDDCISRGDGS